MRLGGKSFAKIFPLLISIVTHLVGMGLCRFAIQIIRSRVLQSLLYLFPNPTIILTFKNRLSLLFTWDGRHNYFRGVRTSTIFSPQSFFSLSLSLFEEKYGIEEKLKAQVSNLARLFMISLTHNNSLINEKL